MRNTMGKIALMLLATALVTMIVVVVVLVSTAPKVKVVNDLPISVTLWSCRRDPQDLASGSSLSTVAYYPCVVRSTATNETLGCLLFSGAAFEEHATTRVGSMEAGLSESECVDKEDYGEYYLIWNRF